MKRVLALLIGLAWLASPVQALGTPEEVLACVARNEPHSSVVQTIALRSHDRLGGEATLKARLYWRRHPGERSELLMEFFEPEDMSGGALLIEERVDEEPTILLYVPALGRAKRVSAAMSSGPVLGTDFSFEDLQHVYGIARYGELRLGADREVEGRAVRVVEGRPHPASPSSYVRVVMAVDAETCVPLRMAFFGAGDRLRKRMAIDPEQVRSEGGTRLPGSILMSDLRNETWSELVVEAQEVGAEIASQTFDPAWRAETE